MAHSKKNSSASLEKKHNRAALKSSAQKTAAKKPAPKAVVRGVEKGKKISAEDSFKREIINKLLKAKKDLLAEVAEKRKSESNTLKFEIGDIYDIASSERDRELTLMLGDRDREKLAEIEDALDRIKGETYGVCEECGEPIAEARLLAMPFTHVCIDCKSRDEKERGGRKRYEEEPALAILEKTEVEEEY